MNYDYRLVLPSLGGILGHQSLSYEGLRRPPELMRILDGPVKYLPDIINGKKEQKVLDQYFHDLYGVFMKKFAYFFVESEPVPSEAVKLQAMLQEMIKVKMLISKNKLDNSPRL